MFYCTRLDCIAQTILSAYSRRWAIEVTFQNAKQHLGLEAPANRIPLAVQRTAPMPRILYSLIVAWFHLVEHKRVKFSNRPWYTDKTESSFADMLNTLRQESWHENLLPVQSTSRLMKTLLTRLVDFLSLAAWEIAPPADDRFTRCSHLKFVAPQATTRLEIEPQKVRNLN